MSACRTWVEFQQNTEKYINKKTEDIDLAVMQFRIRLYLFDILFYINAGAMMSSVKELIKKCLPASILKAHSLICNSDQRKKVLFEKLSMRYSPNLPDFPPMVMVDTTTRCNLACNHCPNSVLSVSETWGGDMSYDLYKKIIDEIARENPETIVRPFNSGEPLMRNDIEVLIRYAKNKGTNWVSINSNGTLLTDKRARSILDSGLDHIEISIDAFSKETYKKIKNVDMYDRVVQNTENLITIRKKGSYDLRVSVSFVRQKDNFQELEAFSHYWRNKADVVTVREFHQHGGLIGSQGKYLERRVRRRPPCPYLWDRMIVEHNGDVRFCENDWKVQYKIGSVIKQSLKKIWLSEPYQNLRQSHVLGEFDHPFCQRCSDWDTIG
jgi:radical SAM protein with 4Fe4S-binding SPASM domain